MPFTEKLDFVPFLKYNVTPEKCDVRKIADYDYI